MRGDLFSRLHTLPSRDNGNVENLYVIIYSWFPLRQFFNCLVYVALNGSLICEKFRWVWVWKQAVVAYFKVISQHLPGGM
jgi:hypothetical protein